MKERPILFSGPMVRAMLEGRKTMTRRIAKPQPDEDGLSRILPLGQWQDTSGMNYKNRYGEPGDRLWVREAHSLKATENGWRARYPADGDERLTDVDVDCHTDERWDDWVTRPSIHMYRWASRILLEITDVRVERLQEISEADAKAEGLSWVAPTYGIPGIAKSWNGDARESFRALWESINGPGSWDANPWVWVVCFKRVK